MKTSPTWRILVPLDGSALAEQALWVAARLVRQRHGVLHLVTVCLPAGETGETTQRIHHDLRGYLEAKGEEVATTHGVRHTCEVLHGWPPEALADYVRDKRITLVVMTAHGQSGASPCWIGSVTEALLTRTGAPVLVLRPDSAPPGAPFSRILVALDGSAGSNAVVAQAITVGAAEPGTEFTLVEIIEPPMTAPGRPDVHPRSDAVAALVRRRDAAAQALERRADRLRKAGLAVTSRVVIAEGVAELLNGLATSFGSELIVVGTHSPHPTERLLLGSVADKVVRGAAHPVLVVPVGRAPGRAVDRTPRHRTAREASRSPC